MKGAITVVGIVIIAGCIDPVKFNYQGQTEHLVVQAELTNYSLRGLNYVLLTRSSSFDFPFNQYEDKDSVFITSKEGEICPFRYFSKGYYHPESGFKGIIGHTYTLNIVTPDGLAYQSEPVTMKAAIPIDTVYALYSKEYTIIHGEENKILSPGYNLFVKYRDPVKDENFYRWTYQLQYKVNTSPDKYLDSTNGYPWIPAPKKCCSVCWVSDFGQSYTVANDRLNNGNEIADQNVMFLPYLKYLNIRCKVIIYQHSVSEEEYQFYNTMKMQIENNGGILDPPPSEIKGNIHNVENKDEKVIGFFDASGLSDFDIYLDGKDFPGPKASFNYNDDCRRIPDSSVDPPGGWQ